MATVKEYILQEDVRVEFDLSIFDDDRILSSVWSIKMSKDEFITLITSRFTYWQLYNIFTDIHNYDSVNKSTVKEYLRKTLHLEEIEVITAPLKETGMTWDEFYSLMVFKSHPIRYSIDQLRI
ncbi:uncharacterized protein LOC126843326 [Adelges cooleyi]|uniref:uncharacterized protein LOC126843326 n=1 Tax=Adelges cooleyi TaxID=133065 RepID=UPI0021807696|nr:uncharacterized protein LOC126843326 [Adelges cooleyi]